MVKSVLFVCNMNSIRSPIAATLMRARAKGAYRVDSAGVYEGGLDPFAVIVMDEVGHAMGSHEPKPLSDVDLDQVDLLIALTPQAVEEAQRMVPHEKIEFWETENPAGLSENREKILAAYRAVRDDLAARIEARFPELQESA